MKKIYSVCMAAVVAVSLAACGQSAQTASSSQSQPLQASSSSDPVVSSVVSSTDAQGSGNESQNSSNRDIASEPASSSEPQEVEPTGSAGTDTLVVYFSASGNTRAVAEAISETLDADLYELVPEEPYTDADLNWNNPESRVNTEHGNPSHRTAIAGGVKDLSGYDTIFLGYPLWWREAPSIVWNFVESSNLAGKTVIPFCTSMSDGFGSSGDTLEAIAPDANWLEGQRFGESLDTASVSQWLTGLDAAA